MVFGLKSALNRTILELKSVTAASGLLAKIGFKPHHFGIDYSIRHFNLSQLLALLNYRNEKELYFLKIN